METQLKPTPEQAPGDHDEAALQRHLAQPGSPSPTNFLDASRAMQIQAADISTHDPARARELIAGARLIERLAFSLARS